MRIQAIIAAVILALLVLPGSIAGAHGMSWRDGDGRQLSRSSPRRPEGGRWICNAYGYGGPRNAWSTVTGARSGSQAAASADALNECRRKLNGCRSSGCWAD